MSRDTSTVRAVLGVQYCSIMKSFLSAQCCEVSKPGSVSRGQYTVLPSNVSTLFLHHETVPHPGDSDTVAIVDSLESSDPSGGTSHLIGAFMREPVTPE